MRALDVDRSTLAAAFPLALAAFVFGTIFGAIAVPLAGPWVTALASGLIFSGAVQFAVVGLFLAQASPISAIAAAAALNLRHLLLGAIIRPHLDGSARRRAALAWFLTDESFGLALASRGRAGDVLLTSGGLFYVAWLAGTVVGIAGGSLSALQEMAAAAFPVLFIGLAAITARTTDAVARAVVAALLAAALAVFFPDVRGLAPVIAAVVVALPGRTRP